jgi:hypothetical protein
MNYLRLFLILYFALVLPGCALTDRQTLAVTQFAESSRDLGAVAEGEFNHFRSATIEMNTTNAILGGRADIGNLDGDFDPDPVLQRVKAAKVLSTYGNLLLLLASDSQADELRLATSHFVNSLQSAGGAGLDRAQLEGFGVLVQTFGNFWVEAKKAKAVKQIVKDAAPAVGTICNLLIADLSPTALNQGQGFDETATRLSSDAALALKDPKIDQAKRSIAIGGIQRADAERTYLHQISAKTVAGITTLKTAHTELLQVLENDQFSQNDLSKLGQEALALETAVQVLSPKP